MLNTVKISIKREEVIEAIKAMKKKERESFLEDLIAAVSPEYLKSVREARADYKTGRVKTHADVFNR